MDADRPPGTRSGCHPGTGGPAAPGRAVRVREAVAAAAQHGLLFGFAAVAAGISAQGLTGFARDNMRLAGPWPYLLFFALDGAAGLCAVLLLRRAARGQTALAPRLAVQGLVAASAAFNAAHAPARPGAAEAFALMPVIAAVLFEFSLRETRRNAGRPDRQLTAQRWLRPAERIRVALQLAADHTLTAHAATRHVRASHAAARLYQLRRAQHARDIAAKPGQVAGRRVRRAERRARAALARAGFADPAVAAEVLRQAQVLTLTPALAGPGYTTPHAANAALTSLITANPAPPPPGRRGTTTIHNGSRGVAHPPGTSPSGTTRNNRHQAPGLPAALTAAKPPGHFAAGMPSENGHATALADAATRIAAAARRDGVQLSQAALAAQLRAQGYRIAGQRLNWLAEVTGLSSSQEQT